MTFQGSIKYRGLSTRLRLHNKYLVQIPYPNMFLFDETLPRFLYGKHDEKAAAGRQYVKFEISWFTLSYLPMTERQTDRQRNAAFFSSAPKMLLMWEKFLLSSWIIFPPSLALPPLNKLFPSPSCSYFVASIFAYFINLEIGVSRNEKRAGLLWKPGKRKMEVDICPSFFLFSSID